MVGDFFILNHYYASADLKGKQALLESNLPAIKSVLIQKMGAVIVCSFFIHFLVSRMASKNSFFVRKIYIPLNEVDSVFDR